MSVQQPEPFEVVFDLHRLAAGIYARGWRDGHLVGSDLTHREQQREREASARVLKRVLSQDEAST